MKNDNRAEELMMLIMSAGRLLHQRLHGSGKISPVSILQFKILCFVAKAHEPSMKDLARFLGVTPPSATVLVQRLARHGLIRHAAPGGDQRNKRIALTAAGEKNLKASRQAMVKTMNKILSRLDAKDLSQLLLILNKLLKA